MPRVGKKHFAYTKKGIAAAKKYAEKKKKKVIRKKKKKVVRKKKRRQYAWFKTFKRCKIKLH